jgi:hypothetical protein
MKHSYSGCDPIFREDRNESDVYMYWMGTRYIEEVLGLPFEDAVATIMARDEALGNRVVATCVRSAHKVTEWKNGTPNQAELPAMAITLAKSDGIKDSSDQKLFEEITEGLLTQLDTCYKAGQMIFKNEQVDTIAIQQEVLGFNPEFQAT